MTGQSCAGNRYSLKDRFSTLQILIRSKQQARLRVRKRTVVAVTGVCRWILYLRYVHLFAHPCTASDRAAQRNSRQRLIFCTSSRYAEEGLWYKCSFSFLRKASPLRSCNVDSFLPPQESTRDSCSQLRLTPSMLTAMTYFPLFSVIVLRLVNLGYADQAIIAQTSSSTLPPAPITSSASSSLASRSSTSDLGPDCSAAQSRFNDCESASPGFSTFGSVQAASCACYTSGLWAPRSLDAPYSQCYDYVTDNYPQETSRAAAIRVNLGMCSSVGNILKLPAAPADNIKSTNESGERIVRAGLSALELFAGFAGLCLLGALAL